MLHSLWAYLDLFNGAEAHMSLIDSAVVFLLGSLVLLFANRFRSLSGVSDTAARLLATEKASSVLPVQESEAKERENLARVNILKIALGACAGLIVTLLRGGALSSALVPMMTGAGVVWLVMRVRREQGIQRMKEEVEFYLPVFMEQVVMAVQAGLDVVPAIRAALDGKACGTSKLAEQLEQVLALTEQGMPFISSLDAVAQRAITPSVRHAFIHLKLAFSQGGELVRPLRELSDATQIQYQENVEEEIARLPVKAVLPLVCTFAGLMVCFLTVPLIQLSGITKKVAQQQEANSK